MKKSILVVLSCAVMIASVMSFSACDGAGKKASDGAYDKEALKTEFLADANEVQVTETAVTFKDASGKDSVTIGKNPQKVYNLYSSFTTLWYETGGTVAGCIGGSSAVELYNEYIGRDITQDAGVNVVAKSASGKQWSAETIIEARPDLIICSTAMSGYSTISEPAQAANIPVIAVDYDDFNDYLKWFKVFCNLDGHPELWDSIAMKALDKVVEVLMEAPTENNPKFLSLFAQTGKANTKNTLVCAMAAQLRAIDITNDWSYELGTERIDVNMESVYAAQPAMILVQCHEGEEKCKEQLKTALGGNPLWNELDAVKNEKVYYLKKTLFHNKPNSKFAEAYQELAQILYPDVKFSFLNK